MKIKSRRNSLLLTVVELSLCALHKIRLFLDTTMASAWIIAQALPPARWANTSKS
jgi:hypothetical protein